MRTFELVPVHDSRKSFYGKARVIETKHTSTLESYFTPVLKFDRGTRKITLLPELDSSQTTLRHVKEFLKQLGYKADTLNQIRKDYA